MNSTAIMDGDRTSRPHEILGLVDLRFRQIPLGQATDPFAAVIILVEQGALMTAGKDPKRPLIRPAVVQISSDRQRAVVGMRPELNVLVPFHLLAPFRPFEIKL